MPIPRVITLRSGVWEATSRPLPGSYPGGMRGRLQPSKSRVIHTELLTAGSSGRRTLILCGWSPATGLPKSRSHTRKVGKDGQGHKEADCYICCVLYCLFRILYVREADGGSFTEYGERFPVMASMQIMGLHMERGQGVMQVLLSEISRPPNKRLTKIFICGKIVSITMERGQPPC